MKFVVIVGLIILLALHPQPRPVTPEPELLMLEIRTDEHREVTVTQYHRRRSEPTAILEKPIAGWTAAISRDLLHLGWMGKRVYIEGLGVFKINDLMADTVQGHHIDIYAGSKEKAMKFGKRTDVSATVLESTVQQQVRLEASRRGARLFRNNNGACRAEDGRQIRYGLGNDSSQVNAVMKSSDLIGITPVEINGVRYGIFTSYEIKHPGWKYTGTDREIAQNNWLMLVTSLGGIARFVTDVGDIIG